MNLVNNSATVLRNALDDLCKLQNEIEAPTGAKMFTLAFANACINTDTVSVHRCVKCCEMVGHLTSSRINQLIILDPFIYYKALPRTCERLVAVLPLVDAIGLPALNGDDLLVVNSPARCQSVFKEVTSIYYVWVAMKAFYARLQLTKLPYGEVGNLDMSWWDANFAQQFEAFNKSTTNLDIILRQRAEYFAIGYCGDCNLLPKDWYTSGPWWLTQPMKDLHNKMVQIS